MFHKFFQQQWVHIDVGDVHDEIIHSSGVFRHLSHWMSLP